MADHNIRVILQAIDKGSAQARKFFGNINNEVDKTRNKLRGLRKEEEEIFLFGGGKAKRGAGGRFEKERSNIEKATGALRKFKTELKSLQDLGGGLGTGLGEEREIRRQFDERRKLSKKAIADEKQAERDRLEEELRDIRNAHAAKLRLIEQSAEEGGIIEIKARRNAQAKELSDQRNFVEDLIRIERQAALKRGDEVFEVPKSLRERSNELDKQRQIILATRDAEVDAVRKRLRLDEDVAKSQARARSREKLSGIAPESDLALFTRIRDEVRGLRGDLDKSESRLRLFGISAGRAFGEFRSGIRLAKNGLTDFEKEQLRAGSAAQRMGAHLGNAIRPAGAFRTRTLLLIGALQIFGTVVVQAGSALVALASSALEAASALGGALLAGVTQLLPIVGLLAAAFSRLGKVLDAVKLSDKLDLTSKQDQKTKLDQIKQATQRLADSRYSLVKAGEAVKDAEYDLAQAHRDVKDAIEEQHKAVKDLRDARKQAARDIVDANFEEKEAALALADAEQAVVDAKKKLREEEQSATQNKQNIEDAQAQVKEAQARLAQARAEGDQKEIAVALQQLSVAEQDLQQIQADATKSKDEVKKAKNDVKQAELDHQEAIVRNKRAQQDAAKARKDGIEGSDRVISAQKNLIQATRAVAQAERQVALSQRGVRDAVHSLAVAKREEKDAEDALTDSRKKATSQQQQLQNALGDLSPAEKKLFKSIERIKDIYKKNFRPITDIIISSFARAVDTIAPLLQDPKILGGARKLATAIAGSVDKLAHFAVSPEFKKFIEFTLQNAAKNVPKITDGFIALGRVLIRVARAATPIFNDLLDRFVKFLKRLDEGTRDPKRLNKFFGIAADHLDSWLKFFGAVGRVLGLLIKFSAPAGKGILDDLTGGFDHIADWLDEHETEVKQFFANVRIQVGALAQSLGKMAIILFKAFSSDSASDLSIFLIETVIPAFALFLKILGLIAKFLNAIFSIPLIGPVAKDVVRFALALLIATKFIATIIPLLTRLNALFKIIKESTILLRIQLLALAAVEKIVVVFNAIRAAIIGIGVASKAALLTPPVGLIAIIVGIIAAIVLLDRKFHFLRPTLEFLLKLFQKVFNWIKDHWKLLIIIMTGPFGIILAAIVKWHDKIIALFKGIVDFVREHWKLIVAILLAPFAIGGAIILGLIKWREKIFEFFKAIPGKILGFFETLPQNLKKIFDKIPGLLKEALKGLGGIVTSAIKKIPGGGKLLGLFGVGGKSEEEKFADFLKDPALDAQDRKKAKRLKDQGLDIAQIIQKLAKDQGITVSDAKNLLGKYAFKDGGGVPGRDGQAVPILAHAGEWVLNKEQQMKVARNLGMSVQQLQMNLFGTGGASTAGTRPTLKAKPFSSPGKFNLVPKEDPDGNVVWFIEMADGAFGQVSARDARRIIATNGEFIPGYVRRSSHGFNARFKSASGGYERARGKVRHYSVDAVRDRGWQKFAKGGIVQSWAGPGLQSFAEGGTVLQQSGFGAPAVTTTKSVEQNFNVTTQGETDWNYVLRLGALHANSSYT